MHSAVFDSFRLPRTLHLIDIENLVDGEVHYEALNLAFVRYQAKLDPGRFDTLIVSIAARHHRLLADLTAKIRTGQGAGALVLDHKVVVGHDGRNGADDALLMALELVEIRSQPLSDDFPQVVFASGDGRFVARAEKLKGQGIVVVNVATGSGSRADAWEAKVAADLKTIGSGARRRKRRKKTPPADRASRDRDQAPTCGSAPPTG